MKKFSDDIVRDPKRLREELNFMIDELSRRIKQSSGKEVTTRIETTVIRAANTVMSEVFPSLDVRYYEFQLTTGGGTVRFPQELPSLNYGVKPISVVSTTDPELSLGCRVLSFTRQDVTISVDAPVIVGLLVVPKQSIQTSLPAINAIVSEYVPSSQIVYYEFSVAAGGETKQLPATLANVNYAAKVLSCVRQADNITTIGSSVTALTSSTITIDVDEDAFVGVLLIPKGN